MLAIRSIALASRLLNPPRITEVFGSISTLAGAKVCVGFQADGVPAQTGEFLSMRPVGRSVEDRERPGYFVGRHEPEKKIDNGLVSPHKGGVEGGAGVMQGEVASRRGQRQVRQRQRPFDKSRNSAGSRRMTGLRVTNRGN